MKLEWILEHKNLGKKLFIDLNESFGNPWKYDAMQCNPNATYLS
jgi:hypothetical protein